MEIKAGRKFWMMQSPDGKLWTDTSETTQKYCWEKFCYPALNKEAYEKAGWKPVMVYINVSK